MDWGCKLNPSLGSSYMPEKGAKARLNNDYTLMCWVNEIS